VSRDLDRPGPEDGLFDEDPRSDEYQREKAEEYHLELRIAADQMLAEVRRALSRSLLHRGSDPAIDRLQADVTAFLDAEGWQYPEPGVRVHVSDEEWVLSDAVSLQLAELYRALAELRRRLGIARRVYPTLTARWRRQRLNILRHTQARQNERRAMRTMSDLPTHQTAQPRARSPVAAGRPTRGARAASASTSSDEDGGGHAAPSILALAS
jgi:hypothetical protein